MKRVIRYKRMILSLSFYILLLSLLGCKEELLALNPFKKTHITYHQLDTSYE